MLYPNQLLVKNNSIHSSSHHCSSDHPSETMSHSSPVHESVMKASPGPDDHVTTPAVDQVSSFCGGASLSNYNKSLAPSSSHSSCASPQLDAHNHHHEQQPQHHHTQQQQQQYYGSSYASVPHSFFNTNHNSTPSSIMVTPPYNNDMSQISLSASDASLAAMSHQSPWYSTQHMSTQYHHHSPYSDMMANDPVAAVAAAAQNNASFGAAYPMSFQGAYPNSMYHSHHVAAKHSAAAAANNFYNNALSSPYHSYYMNNMNLFGSPASAASASAATHAFSPLNVGTEMHNFTNSSLLNSSPDSGVTVSSNDGNDSPLMPHHTHHHLTSNSHHSHLHSQLPSTCENLGQMSISTNAVNMFNTGLLESDQLSTPADQLNPKSVQCSQPQQSSIASDLLAPSPVTVIKSHSQPSSKTNIKSTPSSTNSSSDTPSQQSDQIYGWMKKSSSVSSSSSGTGRHSYPPIWWTSIDQILFLIHKLSADRAVTVAVGILQSTTFALLFVYFHSLIALSPLRFVDSVWRTKLGRKSISLSSPRHHSRAS